jgi:primosomal protein N' (replication factor Y) (superfamily II helicase)
MSAPSSLEPSHRLTVAVELPQHAGWHPTLDYLSERMLAPGTLVRVPLGRREVPGMVWGVGESDAEWVVPLKPIGQALEALPPLSASWRALASFAATYYQRGLGELALAVLPPALRQLDATQLARRLKRLPSAASDVASVLERPLTPDQQAAVDAIAAAGANTFLLHGVTGSGKTEVYMAAAEQALAQGRQVLVLVPEINLTPQLEARFAARFAGRRIASLHSALTPAQRLQHWLAAHLGHADLVLGTRLAVFASMPRLGLIVVDEEHDPSFKQQEGARYSARDLAVWRGKNESVTVVLGSATPALESWHRAQQQSYHLLSMPERIGGGVLPQLHVVDMNRQPRADVGAGDALSMPLVQALRERVERGEQSLLLLNRRGYAPVLNCTACGWKSACKHCSAWRVFHKADRTLRCHHCGFAERVPRACPDCGNLDIHATGRGTERLEEQLSTLLPGARIARIDADTTRLKGSLEAQLAAVHEGDVDVLVGTQMVAKGHDFRRMTLVAAVSPDNALYSSDFRAPERLFALLMQAAGRAGRDAALGARSQMWVQTWNPRHPLFAALAQHDYAAFAQSQLAEREAAGLPPFASLALLRAEARHVAAATGFLRAAAEAAAQLPQAPAVMLYPPVPPALARVADVERVQMLIESSSRAVLQRFLSQWLPALNALGKDKSHRLLRWAIDVDPLAI